MTYDVLTPNAHSAQLARKQILSGVLTLGKPTGLKWLRAGDRQPGEGRELTGYPALADALQHQTEFTQQEWDAFGVSKLRVDHWVKAGAHHYRPAGLLDTTFSHNVSFSGHAGQPGTEWGAKYEFISETCSDRRPPRLKPVLVLYGSDDVGKGGGGKDGYGAETTPSFCEVSLLPHLTTGTWSATLEILSSCGTLRPRLGAPQPWSASPRLPRSTCALAGTRHHAEMPEMPGGGARTAVQRSLLVKQSL